MKQSQAIVVALVALVVGFGSGFMLRPVLAPPTEAPPASPSPPATAHAEQPNEAEATAAVRRFRAGFNTYSEATLTLGDCSPGGQGPGVTCMAQITLRPGSAPQNRPIGFARVGGRWEVSVW